MKRITFRDQVRDLPSRMKRCWQRKDGSWVQIRQPEPDTEKIYNAVCALDPETVTHAQLIETMGFDGSWAAELHRCHECHREVPLVVELGEEPDYESYTAQVCPDCLRAALELV